MNTLHHLVLALDRDDPEAAFRRHARALSASTGTAGMRTVAHDGKTLRGSFDHVDATANVSAKPKVKPDLPAKEG